MEMVNQSNGIGGSTTVSNYKKQNKTYSVPVGQTQSWVPGVEYSDALDFEDEPEQGISVIALSDLVATIPKSACLTVKTSGASEVIGSAGLGGSLGLAFALMYEKSLGEDSPWAGYLQLLPEQESVPYVWSIEEVDSLLCRTELHKADSEKRQKVLIFEDWKVNILPLLDSADVKLNPDYFGVEQYFAAKSLTASRSFEIDDYRGSGMVPLADLPLEKHSSSIIKEVLLYSSVGLCLLKPGWRKAKRSLIQAGRTTHALGD